MTPPVPPPPSPPQDRVVIAVAYDCVEKMVYWTDITGPAISRAGLSGGDVVPVVTAGQTAPAEWLLPLLCFYHKSQTGSRSGP